MADRLLTPSEILNIPKELMPMMVFSDNPSSFLGWGIKARTQGYYSHFMWLIAPGILATQNWLFCTKHISDYLKGKHTLKFVYSTEWTPESKAVMLTKINLDLGKPWWKRRYDLLAIFGQLIGCKWIQAPWVNICSERDSYICLADSRYDLGNPSPADVNRWTKEHNPPYCVYGRYVPD